MKEFNIEKYLQELLNCPDEDQWQTLYSNLDDAIPFLLFLNKEEEAKQIISRSLPETKNGFFPIRGSLYSSRMDEFLGGVLAYYKKTKDNSLEKIVSEQKETLSSIFSHNFLPGIFIEGDPKRASRAVYSRGYNLVEVVLENKDVLGENIIAKALESLDNMIAGNFFQKNGLFLNKYIACGNILLGGYLSLKKKCFFGSSSIYFHNSLGGRIKRTLTGFIPFSGIQIMKDNTNLVFSIIEAYKKTKSPKYKAAVVKFIESVLKNVYSDAGYIFFYSDSNNIKLTQNFAFMEVLLDYCRFIERNKKYEKILEDMAKFWLDQKDPSGLIYEDPHNKKKCLIDPQTDFSIVLKKLGVLLGKEEYKNEGRNLYEKMIENLYNGKTMRGGLGADTFSLKYNFLFLKAVIANNYEVDIFDSLFKDR